jgi:prepilin-type N-terminal cleavage/methylation domain-containing protein
MKRLKNRTAFTLIEIIMVIVILGVVAMIGTDIIARMYQGYLHSKIINELQQKTELALDQIAKRLKYRVKATAVTKDASDLTKFKRLSNDTNDTYNMLEWIGYDNEGLLGDWNNSAVMPGWNGFIDLYSADTNASQISTKGSRLDFAERTIFALSYGDVNMSGTSATNQFPAIIFKKLTNQEPIAFGLHPISTEHNNTYRVKRSAGNVDLLEFEEDDSNKTLSEQYYLAWSAYALVPDVTASDDDFNLTLYYNYQPWHGEKFTNARGQSVIAEHVSTFRYTQTGNTIRIKLCIQDDNQTGTPIAFCKEKAVF